MLPTATSQFAVIAPDLGLIFLFIALVSRRRRERPASPLHSLQSGGFDSADIIFEVVSAASNVGITTGFVNPGMSPAAKWLFILVMWAGRLEIVPVIVLIEGAARRFR